MANKIGYLVSKVPGWTPGTKSGAPVGVLGEGQMVRASDVPDVITESVQEGGIYAAYADYVEYDDNSPEVAGAARDPSAQNNPTAPTSAGQGVAVNDLTGDGASGGGMQGSRTASHGGYNPEEHKVADVLSYLEGADEAEVSRVKEAEASSDRKSTQIANFGS